MILILNLKNYPDFIINIFKGENYFFNKLIDLLIPLKNNDKFIKIINNLFLEEYKIIFFNDNKKDNELEILYEEEKKLFTEKYTHKENNEAKESYIELFSKILKFDLNYNNFFSDDSEKIDLLKKSAYKLSIVQSLIRIIFSKEKKNYTDEKYYEFKVIKRIIDKDVEETIEKYGDEYKTLFRKEDICDDFLKYIFYIFGNKMMVESFVNPIKKELRKIGFNNRDINKEEFNLFIETFINNLKATIPNVLKILLKLLYESIRSHFTIDADNYGPLYTTLIFNFFNSPRVQGIFNINSQKNAFVRSLNRLLRNACFNFKFNDGDPLSIFNDIIENNHLKIKNFIKNDIINIDIESDVIKKSLEDIFGDKKLLFPNFLFYSDCNLLYQSLNKGINNYIDSEELKNSDWIII